MATGMQGTGVADAAEPGARDAWIALGAAMVLASALILWAGRGTSFGGDELDYYARYLDRDGVVDPAGLGLEYLFAPHNGHLQLTGKLVYEALFATAGTGYVVFRLVEVIGVVLCVGLFFELARRRVGGGPALAMSVLLLFMGAAWEVMLWPFDLHTVYAFAAGLAALVALERGGRVSDLACCLLLILSIITIEVGLAFLVGVSVSVLLRADRMRRAWVFLAPLALYGAWWLWAQQFGQSDVALSNLVHLATSVASSLAATLGSLTGLIEVGPGIFAGTVGSTGFETVLAILAGLALAYRLGRGGVPASLWVFMATLLTYWAFIALAARPPDGSRYMFVGAVLALLIAVEAVRGARASRAVLVALFVLVALALPTNLAKLADGRSAQVIDAEAAGTQYAMLELARDRAAPEYLPSHDPNVAQVGPSPFIGLAAGDYFAAADRVGSLASSLDEVRSQAQPLRAVADASLAGAFGIRLAPTGGPDDSASCRYAAPSSETQVSLELPEGGAVLEPIGGEPVELGLGRFSVAAPSVPLGALPDRGWSELAIPLDTAPERWRVFADGPVRLCSLPAASG